MQYWSAKWRREISKFKVLTTSPHNSKSFILYIYFNGVSTSPIAASSVNSKSATKNSHRFRGVYFRNVGVACVAFKLPKRNFTLG